MKRTYITDVKPGEKVKIQGFVENCRNKRTMAFLVIKDITGKMQVTLEKEKYPELAQIVDELSLYSVITIEGEAVANEYVKLNGIEVLPTFMKIESKADALPIQDDAAIDLKMDYRWIDLRSDRNTFIFKLQTYMTRVMRDFLLDRDFMEIHSPKLIGAASESGSDVFELTYFDRKAYLTQSPQFYKQMAMASGFDKIFEVGPVFRAEKSYTSKHTTEFTGFDLEFSYVESVEDVMQLEEDLLTELLTRVNEKFGEGIKEHFGLDTPVPSNPFPRVTLKQLYADLKEMYGLEVPEAEQCDLTTEAEKLCAQYAQDKYNHEFLFVTDFGVEKRPFYHMRKDGVPQGYDLIWRGVEITTGAVREHRYDILKAQADEKGLGEDVKFYLEFFKYGCPPHGGFGVGLDRLTMLFLGIGIKEAMFLFRGPNRLNP